MQHDVSRPRALEDPGRGAGPVRAAPSRVAGAKAAAPLGVRARLEAAARAKNFPGAASGGDVVVAAVAAPAGPTARGAAMHAEATRAADADDDVACAPAAPPARSRPAAPPSGAASRPAASLDDVPIRRAAAEPRFRDNDEELVPTQRGMPSRPPLSQTSTAPTNARYASAYGGGGASAHGSSRPHGGNVEDEEELCRVALIAAARGQLMGILAQAIHQGGDNLRRAEHASRGYVAERAPRRTVHASKAEYQAWSFILVAPILLLAAAFFMLPIYNAFQRLTGAVPTTY
jgi:hypothetical protein